MRIQILILGFKELINSKNVQPQFEILLLHAPIEYKLGVFNYYLINALCNIWFTL